MATKSKAVKAPKLFIAKGEAANVLRKKLGMNQADFWAKIRITQSGGSRYENGRNVPKAVLLLLHLTYAPEEQALEMLNYLRTQPK
jgi:transcriptional regulator with XRE-family HTH domain